MNPANPEPASPANCHHLLTGPLFSAVLGLALYAHGGGVVHAAGDACLRSAGNLHSACRNDVRDDFYTSRAVCLNLSDENDRRECFVEGREDRRAGNAECKDIRNARRTVVRRHWRWCL